MSSVRFLEYEVALLLAEYGKQALLVALGRKLALSEAQLEALFSQIEREKPPDRRAKRPPAKDPVESVLARHPDKTEQLRSVAVRFQNRLFLPELRDVRRFFEQHAHHLGRPKSREQSLPKLLDLLASLDTAELNAIVKSRERTGYSALGVISDEILQRDR